MAAEQNTNIVKIKIKISTNKVGSECETTLEFDRDVWESMTDDEKDDECRDAAFEYIDWYWEKTD
jgi:hypothetical protein